MKYIITSLVLISAIFSQAQTITKVINMDGEAPFVQTTQSYLLSRFGTSTSDSIRILQVGGEYYFRNTTQWTIKDLHISPTNTAARNTYWLKKAIAASFIKEIIVTDDTVSVFTFTNEALNFNSKQFSFRNGCKFDATSAVTYTNMLINAPVLTQIFTLNINLVTPKSSNGSFYTQWYGAVADGLTNCTAAIRKSFAITGIPFKFPSGLYYINDTISCEKSDVDMGSDGIFYVDYARAAVYLGYSGTNGSLRTNNAYWKVNVRSVYQSNWNDSAFISKNNLDTCRKSRVGIYMRNAYGCYLEVNEASGFTTNIMAIGENMGVELCSFKFNYITNAWCAFRSFGTGAFGYFNSNYIFGGNITRLGPVNTTLRNWGWIMGAGPSDTYGYNNNTWYSPTFQMGYDGYIFRFYSGGGNKIEAGRDEGNNSMRGVFEGNAIGNRFEFTYSWGKMKRTDTSRYGGNTVIGQMDINKASNYPVINWTAVGSVSQYGTNNISIAGSNIYDYTTGLTKPATSTLYVKTRPEFLEFSNFADGSIGWEFYTNEVPNFLIKPSFFDAIGGRIHIKMMDGSGAELPDRVQLGTVAPPTKTTTFGGGWVTGANATDDYHLTVPETCKKVRVIFHAGGGGAMLLKSVVILANFPNTNLATTPGTGIQNNTPGVMATMQPDRIGSYNTGQIIWRATPNADSSAAWQCDQGGTFDNPLSGATASMTNNTNEMTVSGISLDTACFNGQWVLLSSQRFQILGKKNSTTLLTTTNRTGGTVTSQTLTYAIPTFIQLAKPGATGSVAWSSITSKPTTISGYGITDATTTARSAISLTTTGSSGASTYNSSTGVLNIPQYSGGGGGLSGLTSGRVPFANSSTTITDDAGLTWDNTNKRLGVTNSTASQYASMDWYNNTGDLAQMAMLGSSFSTGYFRPRRAVFNTGSPIGLAIGAYDAAGKIFFATGGTAYANIRMVINPNGSISIGDTAKYLGFHVNRSVYINPDSVATGSPTYLLGQDATGKVNKIAASSYAAASHTHTMSSVTDLPATAEGIYSPTFSASGTALGATGDSVVYSRIGNKVDVFGKATVSTNGTGSAQVFISLPFTTSFPSDNKHSKGFVYVSKGSSFIGMAAVGSIQGSSSIFFNIPEITTGVSTYLCDFNFSYRIY